MENSTTHHITYSMADWKFKRMARREKSLLAKPIAWLRIKLAKDLHAACVRNGIKSDIKDEVSPKLKKSQIVWLIMELQFTAHSMEVYLNVKIERSAPKKP